eukprot:Opistho-2@53517
MEDGRTAVFLQFEFAQKKTSTVSFADGILAKVIKDDAVRAVLKQVAAARLACVAAIASKERGDNTAAKQAVAEYTALARGLVAKSNAELDLASPLRHAASFEWTQTFGADAKPITAVDAQFDVANILVAYAFYLLRGVSEGSNSGLDELGCKGIYDVLRTAGGVVDALTKTPMQSGDVSAPILDLLKDLILADAQNVSIAVAQLKGHKGGLLSSICSDTADAYVAVGTRAAALTEASKNKNVAKVAAYAAFKAKAYQALAYSWSAQASFEGDKCGDAIASSRRADKLWEEALELAKAYDKIEPRGKTATADHAFVQGIWRAMKLRHDKYARENDMIYFHKVPEEVPALPTGKRLADFVPFALPPISDKWPSDAMAGIEPIEAPPVTSAADASSK